MSFWRPIGILLALRVSLARSAFKNNPTAQLGSILMTAILTLSALGMGGALSREWGKASPTEALASLEGVLLVVAAVLAIGSLLPGMLSLMGSLPHDSVLKPYPFTRMQRLITELTACLIDIPYALALITITPLTLRLFHAHQLAAAAALPLCTTLLAILTVLVVRLAAHTCMRAMRRFHRALEASLATATLFVLISIALPPAFASLTNPMVAGVDRPRLQAEVGPLRAVSPTHLASSCVVSARAGEDNTALQSLSLLALQAAGIFGAAIQITGRQDVGRRRAEPRTRPRETAARPFRRGSLHLPQLAAFVLTDLKLLLRQPQLFTGLRRPAALILVGFFSLLAPDMGSNPVYSTKEILCLVSTLYPFLWQLQLLCNRFGADAGKAALLFGFSADRRALILGKNLSLFALLLLINGAGLSLLCTVIGCPGAIAPILLRIPVILILATALGNVCTVLQPFAIPRSRGKEEDPPNNLMATYTAVAAGIAFLMECMMPVTGDAALGAVPSVLLVVGLYAASVQFAARRLERSERHMIGILDGGR